MLLLLRNDLTPEDTDLVCASCEALGFRARAIKVGERGTMLLEVEGEVGPLAAAKLRSVLEDQLAVERIIDARGAAELVDVGTDKAGTVVRVGHAVFGGGQAALIGGPCAVEDEDALRAVARGVLAAGGTLLRGGAMKPRSSPYAFQGLGEEAIGMLSRVGREVGLPIVTEVLEPRGVEALLDACDMFQIGSRNMSNTPLLIEVGKTQKPVLLKRGMSATAREFLLAAEYLLAGGNPNIVLCERGIRGFDSATRNVLDVGTVAYLKRVTHLPVIVDPSHAAGRRGLVRPLAKSGIAVGADGLIIEINEAPMHARSDARQAIGLAEFAAIAEDTRRLLAIDGRTLSVSTDSAPTPTH